MCQEYYCQFPFKITLTKCPDIRFCINNNMKQQKKNVTNIYHIIYAGNENASNQNNLAVKTVVAMTIFMLWTIFAPYLHSIEFNFIQI